MALAPRLTASLARVRVQCPTVLFPVRLVPVCALLVAASAVAAPGAEPTEPVGPGSANRVPWTTSRVIGAPDRPPPYRTRRILADLPLERVLDARPEPGTGRLFIADARGRLRAVPRGSNGAQAVTVLDLGREIYGFAFHPRYAENRLVFTYSGDRRTRPPTFVVSRFQMGKDGRIDPASEKRIIEASQNDHFGGSLHFGPDGYLYLGLGDGGGIGDPDETGQDISDLRASLMRIDVDRPSDGRAYGIPADNPFVNTPGARPEVYAFGIRNPWRFAFDRANGDLWVGDVGQDLWESILVVRKGGNYGWSVREGSHPYHPSRKVGPAPIEPPVVEQPHSESRSITGGFVYRGKRLRELIGTYVYGDYDTGTIWGLRRDRKGRVTQNRVLTDTPLRVVAFGEGWDGELLILSYPGEIHVLEPQPARVAHVFPRKLSQTGLFVSTRDLTPASGVVAYDVASPLWSDGADKQRWIALPARTTVHVNERRRWDRPLWEYPDGAVLVKTFALDREVGNPASRKRLETRLWTQQAGQWRGYTYVWNDEDTDAELLGSEGLDRTYEIADAQAPGGKRQQTWHFPSRAECSLCHTASAGFVLGFTPDQLARPLTDPGATHDQLAALERAGLFGKPPVRATHQLVDPQDVSRPLEARARSYLHANCGHCHRPFGGGFASFQLTADVPLDRTGLIGAPAERGSWGLADPRVLVPGKPSESVLLMRMMTLEAGRMPSVASSVVDQRGTRLVRDWIQQLK